MAALYPQKSYSKLLSKILPIAAANVSKKEAAHFDGVAGIYLHHKQVGNETFGKQSYVYLYASSKLAREKLVAELLKLGVKTDDQSGMEEQYNENRLDIKVRYFKGWNWDK